MNPYRNRRVSSSLSKIPYGGFSPVRLQTGIQPRSSSTMASSSVRPTYTQTPWIYTQLKSLSQKRAFLRNGTFVQAELPFSYNDDPVQRSLAPQRVMLSRRIIAYYDLIRASLLLPPVYVLSSGSLPVGLLRAEDEKVPNLSCLSFPIVPSSPAAERLHSVVPTSLTLAFSIFAQDRRPRCHASRFTAWTA